jgi:hypothetical protein
MTPTRISAERALFDQLQQPESSRDAKMVSEELQNLFLELVPAALQRLQNQLQIWTNSDTPPPFAVLAAADQLNGLTKEVGALPLAEVTGSLSQALQNASQGLQSRFTSTMGLRACAEINRLLHQYAAGVALQPSVELLQALRAAGDRTTE